MAEPDALPAYAEYVDTAQSVALAPTPTARTDRHGITLRAGDVLRYTPERGNRWCREGLAEVSFFNGNRDWILCDTFWNCGDRYVLTTAEIKSGEVLFNVNDYDELPERSGRDRWERYAPEDRAAITSQHGLVKRLFVRKGAVEHLPTQIINARERLELAEGDLRYAEQKVARAKQELAALEAASNDGPVA